MFYNQKIEVPISYKGYYFWDNKFIETLDAGFYTKSGFGIYKGKLFVLPTYSEMIQLSNQQVLTKDTITLRLSIVASYKIIDGKKFIENFFSEFDHTHVTFKSQESIRSELQIFLRDFISQLSSSEISESQDELRTINVEAINKKFKHVGIQITTFSVRDIGFPKKIQELFAKKLEAQISAKTDLENARTVVATTRALKNASKMISEDENIKFLQYLETISKISQKGNHSFHFGEFVST